MEYVHKNDCEITRDGKGSAMLIDSEGGEVFTVPDTWTDDQIWAALYLANEAYAVGVRDGRAAKAREIRAALEPQ